MWFSSRSRQSDFHDEQFHRLEDRNTSNVYEHLLFERCVFDNCYVVNSGDPSRRPTFRNMALKDCTCYSKCSIEGAILEDVQVVNLAINDLLIVWAPAMRHVTLRGDFGCINVNRTLFVGLSGSRRGERMARAFDAVNDEYYRNVDWALDISQARFQGLNLEGVPGELVIRDPETQFLVYRERLLSDDWRSIDFRGATHIEWGLKALSTSDRVAEVFATSLLDSELYGGEWNVLRELRRRGIAE